MIAVLPQLAGLLVQWTATADLFRATDADPYSRGVAVGYESALTDLRAVLERAGVDVEALLEVAGGERKERAA